MAVPAQGRVSVHRRGHCDGDARRQPPSLMVLHDLTERIEANRALRSAEERMRFALESAKVGVWDMDYVTGMHTWSETLEAQYGLAPGTFEGTLEAFIGRIHPDDRAEVMGVVEKATKSGTDFSVQHRTILAGRHRAVAPGRWPRRPRRPGATGAGRRHFAGHHRPANPGRAVPPRPRRWKPLGDSREESRTTSTICSRRSSATVNCC